MSGVGPVEFVIIVTVLVMLFGPTLLAFWLGFVLGRKKNAPRVRSVDRPAPVPSASPTPASDAAPEAAPEPATSDQEPTDD